MIRQRCASRLVAGVLALMAVSGCKTDPQVPPEVCQGPDCVELDAAAEPGVVIRIDATVREPVPTSTPDAGFAGLCPGMCVPDDPNWCNSIAEQPGLSIDSGMSYTFGPSGVFEDDASTEPDDPEGADALEDSRDGGQSQEAGGGYVETDASIAMVPGIDDAVLSEAGDAAADASFDAGPTNPVDLPDSGGVVDMGSADMSCQMLPTEDPYGGYVLSAQCAPAGTTQNDGTCTSSADCAPGLACVGEGDCLKYCCEGEGSCGAGSYCTQRRLKAPGFDSSALTVPVCVVPTQCNLMDPFPCPMGEECSCPPGLACFALGKDKARTCAVPGTGEEGDSCPCATGYFCSPRERQCLKLCQFGTDSCGEGSCQAIGEFPDGWGLCVSLTEVDGEEL